MGARLGVDKRRLTRWGWTLAAAILVCGSASIVWFLVPAVRGHGLLERARREGLLRAGYAVEAPYVYVDDHGQLTGEEVETARVVASLLGIPKIEWIQTDFADLIPALREGRFDLIVAGMFITPERAKLVAFSEPTFRVRQALLVSKGNPHRLHSYEDFVTKAATKVAVLQGSIEEGIIRELGVADARITLVPDALTGRVAVESGIVDGLALSSPTIRFMAREKSLGLTEAADPFYPPSQPGWQVQGYGGVAFRKADADLRHAWDGELDTFIGGAQHRAILARFGFTDAELPAGMTTAQILAAGRP